MSKVLTTQNAQITTATVQVKTLTISGKQVTLSVFRQLREEALISYDGTLNGVPWGYVNYHPDKCGGQADHWHVVWQFGADLLRSKVTKKPKWVYRSAAADDLIAAVAWERQQEEGTKYFGCDPPKPFYGADEVRWLLGDVLIEAHVSDATARALRGPVYPENRPPQPPVSTEECRLRLADEIAQERARQARHAEVRAGLAALPHLFIAV